MKHWRIALLPWMVMSVAFAQETTQLIQVNLAHFGNLKTAAYRVGDDCYLPVDALQEIALPVVIEGNSVQIDWQGKSVKLSYRTQAGRKIISTRELSKAIGMVESYDPATGNLDIHGIVKSLSFVNGKLEFTSSHVAKPKISYLSDPDRLIIDFVGVKLRQESKLEIDRSARIGQYKSDTVRLVVEIEGRPLNPNLNHPPTTSLHIDIPSLRQIQPGQGASELAKPATKPVQDIVQNPPVQQTLQPPPSATNTISDDPLAFKKIDPLKLAPASPTVINIEGKPPVFERESKTVVVLNIPLSGAPSRTPTFRRTDPYTLEIFVPGALVDPSPEHKLDTSTISTVNIEQQMDGATYRFNLERPMGIELTVTGRVIKVVLVKPTSGSSRISGKTIVVDPGHGGHDSGARDPAKTVKEKDIALAVSKELARQLTSQGATVILTRSTDVYIDLKERPAIANRSKADLFISVHINSNKKANSTSGSITFYHQKDTLGTLLADCIQAEIAKVSQLPSLGSWSDSRIYDSGFAVLRYATMPAVLLELGFINHTRDRKRLTESDFANVISGAIVRGVKVYLGDESK